MSEQLVANELLAFLQQKLDVMDEVSAIQICSTGFSEAEIAAAKLLLYSVLNKRDKMVSRRRDGTKKSLQDIISLFKETDPDEVPTFVAKDLSKLPPITFDHVDVTSLLKDIVFLKERLAEVQGKLDASQNTVADLRRDLDELRNTVAVSRSSEGSANVNTRRGAACDLSSVSFASAVLSSPPALPTQPAECDTRASRSPAPISAAPSCSAARPPRPVPLPVPAAPAKSVRMAPAAAPKPMPGPEKVPEEDGFVTVQRKKRRPRATQNRCGKAPSESNIRAAKPNTPVYISRLHYTTEAEDIVEYVRRKLRYTPRVQLLESRRNVNFRAFVVRVPNLYLPQVLDEDFWPQDVVFRRFRGQVPPDRAKT